MTRARLKQIKFLNLVLESLYFAQRDGLGHQTIIMIQCLWSPSGLTAEWIFPLRGLSISYFNPFHFFKPNGIRSRPGHWHSFQCLSRIRSNFVGSFLSISLSSQHVRTREFSKTSKIYCFGSPKTLNPQKKTQIHNGLERLRPEYLRII